MGHSPTMNGNSSDPCFLQSLNNLLNPSPEAEARTSHSPTDQRKASLPSIHTLQSPEQQHANIPQYAPPPRHQRSSQSYSVETQALASFAASDAPAPTTWNGYTAPDGSDKRKESSERRPGSGHGFELPPPPADFAQRKIDRKSVV